MEKTNTPIIADTSALVSLVVDTDHNHQPAVKAAELRKSPRSIILPVDIFVETINLIGKKSGHDPALKAARDLLLPSSNFILIESMPYLTAALEKFKDQAPGVSLTDCIVMAVADGYKTKEVFGFDKQFEDAGYLRLTPSTDWK